jgi:hypothetical protein
LRPHRIGASYKPALSRLLGGERRRPRCRQSAGGRYAGAFAVTIQVDAGA